jgi:flagellar biosynthetic protein FliO
MISTASNALAVLIAQNNSSLLKKLGEAAAGEGGRTTTPAGDSDFDFLMAALQMAAALAFVLALLLAAAWAVKRWMPGAVARVSKGDRIDILSARQIGMRRSLILAKVRNRIVLLGATPQQITPLSEWEPDKEWSGAGEEEGEDHPSAIAEFQSLLDERSGKNKERST